MFSRTIAKITASLPSSLKYKIRKFKRIYTFILGLGEPMVEIRTLAGTFHWQIDKLASQAFVLGTYEPYMQKAFLSFIHPGFVVYDIGAHAGFHALFCGLIVGPSGRVIAFEPNPENYASMKQRVMLNLNLPVTLLPYALSDNCGKVSMDTSKGNSQSRVAERGDIIVEAQTIDSLVEKDVISPPQLIKIDVEGYEKQVLRGAVNTLKKHKPVILCDYNDDTTLGTLINILEPFGYSIKTGPPIIAMPDK